MFEVLGNHPRLLGVDISLVENAIVLYRLANQGSCILDCKLIIRWFNPIAGENILNVYQKMNSSFAKRPNFAVYIEIIPKAIFSLTVYD